MKDLNLNNIQAAILEAGLRVGWEMDVVSKGHIIATIFSNEHVAVVDIFYTTESYDIVYKDSKNMDYDGINIHNRYNRWILKLDKDIRRMFGLK